MIQAVFALAVKDLRLLVRDKAGFFFTLFFPLMIAVLFGAMFSGGGQRRSAMPVLLVDSDETEASRAFAAVLDSASELDISYVRLEAAIDLVRRGKAVGYILLRSGFGEASKNIFWGDPPSIQLGIDPARQAEAAMLQGILMKYGSERFQEFFSNAERQREYIADARTFIQDSQELPRTIRQSLDHFLDAWDRLRMQEHGAAGTAGIGGFAGSPSFEPLRIEQVDVARIREGPTNAYQISFPQGIIWGIIGVTAAFGISIVVERSHGTLVRLRMTPVGLAHILAGKGLASFLSTIAISVGLLAIGALVFSIRPGSFPLLGLAILCSSLSFVGIMLLLSVLGRSERAAGGISWAVLLVMSMLGGGMLPLFLMPSWMRTVGHVSPVKWAILSIEGAVWRGFSFGEMLQPCAILLGIGVLSFSVGLLAFRWTTRDS
jgi:ABC-2 type transport system permease protein